MPASAANVPSAVPTLPNLFDAFDSDDGDDYPVVSPRSARSGVPALSQPPPLRAVPTRPTPLGLAPVVPVIPIARRTLVMPVTTPVTIPAPPPSESLLVMFDDDEEITRETLLAKPTATPDFEESLDEADVLEELEAVEHLESGIRRVPGSVPPPLPRAAAATIPAPPPVSESFSPHSSFPAATPPSVPPARGRLWADEPF